MFFNIYMNGCSCSEVICQDDFIFFKKIVKGFSPSLAWIIK